MVLGHLLGYFDDFDTFKQSVDASTLQMIDLHLPIAHGLWTRPVHLGARADSWPSVEVATLNAARIAGKTDDEIRDLVAKLEATRKDVIS